MNKTLQTPSTLLTLLALLSALSPPSIASPGAHGPGGEHLDTPHTVGAGAAASPRLEAKTEQFELVATLAGAELSLLIDRFETNEPLLNALVEVESGGLKAKARFHDDIGDYAVDDEAMLKLLGNPGAHALVITVIAGQESDLLDGTLNVLIAPTEGAASHGLGWSPLTQWVFGGVLALGLLLAALLRQAQRQLRVQKIKGDAA